jgi:hypothetical protein
VMNITRNPVSASADISARSLFENLWSSDWSAVGLLAVLGLATRLPWMSQVLYHWDSVNFAYAMREFNMAQDQPQPPGYIFYVWLTRLVDLLFHDAQHTMLAISITASILAAIALYFLGKTIFNREVGILSALFLLFSPLYWFYGEIALPHTLDALLVTLGALFLFKVMQGDKKALVPAILVLVVAGGVRQQTLVFLAPLILFSLRKVGWKNFILAGLLGGVLCLTWFLPLIVLNGGLANYLKIMDVFSARFQTTTSLMMGAGWWGLTRNATKYALYTLYGWGLFVFPAIAGGVLLVRRGWKTWIQEKPVFLGLWILPVTLFYLVVHMGQQGLVFVYLPALLLLSAAGLVEGFKNARIRGLITTGLILTSAAIFLFLPEFPMGPGGQRFLTRDTLMNSDRYYLERFTEIRKDYPPSSTIIIASNWHHLQYFLPDYKILPFTIGSKREVDEGQPVNIPSNDFMNTPAGLGIQSSGVQPVYWVLFDPDLDAFNQSPDQFKAVLLPDGASLKVAGLKMDDQLSVNATGFGLESR